MRVGVSARREKEDGEVGLQWSKGQVREMQGGRQRKWRYTWLVLGLLSGRFNSLMNLRVNYVVFVCTWECNLSTVRLEMEKII